MKNKNMPIVGTDPLNDPSTNVATATGLISIPRMLTNRPMEFFRMRREE